MTERHAETWVYGGKYLTGAKKLADLWIDATGREMLFKMPAHVIGGIYTVECVRDGDKVQVFPDTLTYLSERMDDKEKLTRYIVRDSCDRIAYKNRRVEKKAGQTDPLDEALGPLLEYARQCRTSADRSALLATIIDRVYRGIWT